MGGIENGYGDGDGIIPVVDVWTKTGVYKRPIMKIYPLEEKLSIRFLIITKSKAKNGVRNRLLHNSVI